MSSAARVSIVVLMVLLVVISRLIEAEIVRGRHATAQSQSREASADTPTRPTMEHPPSLKAVSNQSQPTAAAARSRYLVRKGDTLTGISKRFYGTTVRWKDLLAANRRVLSSPRDLRAGQTLSLPPPK